MRIILFSLFLGVLAWIGTGVTPCQAQVLNIEDPSTPLDSLKKSDFRYGFGLSGNIARQSTWVYDYTILGECVLHRNDQQQLLMNTSWQSTGSNRDVLLRSGFVYFRYTPGFHKPWAPQFFVQQQIDEGLGLQSRFLMGVNARWDAITKRRFSMQWGVGVMREAETWNRTGNSSDSLGRVSFQLIKSNTVARLFYRPNPKCEWSWVNFLQMPLLSGRSGVRWASQISLTLQAWKWLNLQLNYVSMFDTHPVVDIPAYYFTSSTGVSLTP